MIQFESLKLSGFKSFVDKTAIDIGPGLTGIVGPNGCGKSNLVEALRWVMGENSAKRMRGGEMEDVIFAGASGRTARNMADVRLTIDNKARSGPSQYNKSDTIEIIRRIERGKGSAYSINGCPVRAKDVTVFFADVMSGANSPSLVSQGKVTSIISAKPLERRMILEESAGISGLYARRHEAEQRLRAAENNIKRIEDVLNTMDQRLASLSRQSRQASQYRQINEQIRQLDYAIAYAEWLTAIENLRDLESRHQDIDQKVAGILATVTQLTKTQNTQAEDIPALRRAETEAMAALQNKKLELQRIDDAQSQAERALKEAQDSLESIAKDIKHEAQTETDSQAAVENLKTEHESLVKAQDIDTDALEKRDATLEDLKDAVDDKEKRYLALTEDAAGRRAEKQSLEGQLDKARARKDSLKAKLEETLGQLKTQSEKRKTLEDTDALLAEMKTLETELESEKEAYVAAQNELTSSREAIDTQQKTLQEKKDKAVSIDSEIKALKSLIADHTHEDGATEHTRIADQISVPQNLEAAVSRALNDGLLGSIDGNAAMSWKSYALDYLVKNLSTLPTNATPLSSLIKGPGVLQAALSQIGLVEDYKEGETAAQKLSPGQMLVTQAGDLWRWDGFHIKAEAPDQFAIMVKHTQTLKELEGKRPALSTEISKEEAALEEMNRAYAEVKTKVARFDLSSKEQTLQEMRRSYMQKQEALLQMDSTIERLTSQSEDGKSDIEALAKEIKSFESSLAAMDDTDEDSAAETQTKAKEDLDEARQTYQDAMRECDSLRQQINTRKARIHAMADERITLQNRTIRAKERLKELKTRQESLTSKIEELKNAPKTNTGLRETLMSAISELEETASAARDKLAEAESALNETNAALKEAEKTLSAHREERAGLSAHLQTAQENKEKQETTIAETFEMSPQDLKLKLSKNEDADLGALKSKKEALVQKRERIGPVNLRAEVETEELEKEHQTLLAEHTDLSQAIAELRGGIDTLNKEARQRLQLTFDKVNGHFQTLFTTLFGGGQAYLSLIDAEDPLESGLEIYGQPPGKALQSLSLLSGGEQTLTALALIFSMFLTSPSPICVLDEVDAPLDDANVDRFCNLLDKITQNTKTRFLVITHHRLTMARMDRLYGVTMAEKGISKLVSVDLNQSFEFMDEAA